MKIDNVYYYDMGLVYNRIQELETEIAKIDKIKGDAPLAFECARLLSAVAELKTVMKNSTPIKPYAENAFYTGVAWAANAIKNVNNSTDLQQFLEQKL